MKGKMSLRYDEDEDYLEIYFGKIRKGYFREVKDKFFERIDEKTGKVVGYAVFNFTKRKEKFVDVSISLPEEVFA